MSHKRAIHGQRWYYTTAEKKVLWYWNFSYWVSERTFICTYVYNMYFHCYICKTLYTLLLHFFPFRPSRILVTPLVLLYSLRVHPLSGWNPPYGPRFTPVTFGICLTQCSLLNLYVVFTFWNNVKPKRQIGNVCQLLVLATSWSPHSLESHRMKIVMK